MVQAKKALGQHFLTDPSYSTRIARFAGVRETDTVVEIGPGTGHLTEVLLGAAERVIAVEFDRDMISFLQKRLAAFPPARFTLLQADVLEYDWKMLPVEKSFKLVGNLPYNISTRILRKSVDIKERFDSFTFMVQKEVAERVLAGPGGKDYGYFSILMEYHFDRRRGFDVPPGAFQPRPKVVSHVMSFLPRAATPAVPDYRLFERLIARAFAHRRKTLWNNLSGGPYERDALSQGFADADIDPKARPERVTLEQYACLARML